MLERFLKQTSFSSQEDFMQNFKVLVPENFNFGYDVVDKKCIINEYESGIILEAFTKYAQGYKANAIVEIFKEKGYRRKNGMPIGEKYLYSLL